MPPKFSPKIVVDKDLLELPQVSMLAHFCGKPRLHAVGALLRLWLHLQGRTEKARLEISAPAIDMAVEIPGFAAALVEAKLAERPTATEFVFEFFEEYISRKAVVRAKDVARKAMDRADRADSAAPVQPMSAGCPPNKPRKPKTQPKPPPSLIPDEPPILTFPCNGEHKEWHLTASQRDAWEKLYDGVDIMGEMRKALAWVNANRKKTHKGMPAFCVNWLNKACNSGRGTAAKFQHQPKPDLLKQKLRDEMDRKRREDEERNRGRQ